jgi:hypothetical protein
MSYAQPPRFVTRYRRTPAQSVGTIVAGAVAAVAMILFTEIIDRHTSGSGPVLASFVAPTYAFCGLLLIIGAAFPRLGAVTLEVEGEKAIREQRTLFALSGVVCLAVGLFLGSLALGYGKDPVLPTTVAGGIALAAFAGGMAANILLYRSVDELILVITKDATFVTTTVMLLAFGTWSAAAALGVAPMFSPLMTLSAFFGIYLYVTGWLWLCRGLLD